MQPYELGMGDRGQCMNETNPGSGAVLEKVRGWLSRAVESGASDLHLIVGYPPVLRLHGDLVEIPEPPLVGTEAYTLLSALCPPDAVARLQIIPLRGSLSGVPTDPTIYRFYEMIQIYGTTLKALVHEQFGDGIISAINFKLDMKKVEDPEGGSRAVITLDGKFLPLRPF